jgi:ribosomal protein S12 methylthiotransferase accessory factor
MDHALYYCDAQRLGAFDFLRSAPWLEGDLVSDVPPVGGLQALRTQLADAGMEIALIDLTSPDVASYGFSVVRALGAELQPLHCGHGLERRANPRLKALASHINPDPHPLC